MAFWHFYHCTSGGKRHHLMAQTNTKKWYFRFQQRLGTINQAGRVIRVARAV